MEVVFVTVRAFDQDKFIFVEHIRTFEILFILNESEDYIF